MTAERLRKIIEYSERYRTQMDGKVSRFYSFTGISEDKDMLNILQIVRPALRQKGYIVAEMPFADKEIGALCYQGDAFGYILINTSLPKVNANFATCHEVYHAFYPQNEFKAKAEFADDYFEHEEEYEANIFAGMLLMPESSFRQMYRVFLEQSDNDELSTIIRLMNYYQVPYMAALIRCYELGLTQKWTQTQQLIALDKETIKEKLESLWLDSTILDASNKDDYNALEKWVQLVGAQFQQDGYLNERTLYQAVLNMRSLYKEIKGERK